MAKATSTSETVIESVTLTLTGDEAVALATVLGSVGGHPDKSPRGLINGISSALASQGVYSKGSSQFSPGATAIYFKDGATL